MKTIITIREKIQKLPKKKMSAKEQEFVGRYLGSSKKCLGTKTGDLVKIAKDVLKENNFSTKELIELLSNLFNSNSFEEHIIGGKIFTFLKPEERSKIPFPQLEKWLSKTQGWVEVDVICQSTYSSAEVKERWQDWQKMIESFRKSKIISLRRASLVLQNPSVRKSDDKNIRKLAFETIDELKAEKDVLITKAISWLLRSLVDKNKEEVKKYLIQNESTLPRIAFWETMKKIKTGKKTKS